jgi:selenocysteine lyase/cysteine desulfurase
MLLWRRHDRHMLPFTTSADELLAVTAQALGEARIGPVHDERVGVASFTLEGHTAPAPAARLGDEYAIAVRHGCFCAHPLITRLLGISEAESRRLHRELRSGREPELPGAVRASIGLGTTILDIDALITALDAISRRR